MLRIEELTVRFGRVDAVRDLSLEIPSKGIIALIGPNGAGKSTLLDVLSGFVHPFAGEFQNNGTRGFRPADFRQLSARLHQALVLPSGVTVSSYLRVAAEPSKASWLLAKGNWTVSLKSGGDQDTLALAQRVMRTVGLSLDSIELLDRLSWGQRRVVALTAVVLAPKNLILLDEPFAGLASGAAKAVSTLLQQVATKRPIIVAEHDLDKLLPLADLLLIMVGGCLAASFQDGEVPRSQILQHYLAPRPWEAS